MLIKVIFKKSIIQISQNSGRLPRYSCIVAENNKYNIATREARLKIIKKCTKKEAKFKN